MAVAGEQVIQVLGCGLRYVIVLGRNERQRGTGHGRGRVYYTGCRRPDGRRVTTRTLTDARTLLYVSRVMAERDLANHCADVAYAHVLAVQ